MAEADRRKRAKMRLQPRDLGLAVAVLTALLTLLSVVIGLLMWLFPSGPSELVGRVPGSLDEDATNEDLEEPLSPTVPATKPDGPPTREPESMSSVRLGSGQQRVLFGGDLALGADFNRVGAQIVPTLHLQAGDGPTKHYALLSTGGSYEARGSRGNYRVWVLSIDSKQQELEVRAARGGGSD